MDEWVEEVVVVVVVIVIVIVIGFSWCWLSGDRYTGTDLGASGSSLSL